MPTYEYKCTKCGDRFDVFQQMTDEPLETCEKCAGRLKRLIGAGAGIIFKGSGFYCTDYRNSSPGGAAGKGGETGTDTPKADSPAAADSTKSAEKPSAKKEPANV